MAKYLDDDSLDELVDQIKSLVSTKMDKANPTGTGALSINRKDNTTVGNYSTALGFNNTASGGSSFATGASNTASGDFSATMGAQNTASGHSSVSLGYGTTAQRKSQLAFGKYNVLDTQGSDGTTEGQYIEMVGNGTSDNSRSNARTLDWSGNETLAGYINASNVSKYTNNYMLLKLNSNFTITSSDQQVTNLIAVYSNVVDNSIVFDSTNSTITVSEDVKTLEIISIFYVYQDRSTGTVLRYSNAIKLNGLDFGYVSNETGGACSYISSEGGYGEKNIEVVNDMIVDLTAARAHSTQTGQTANVFSFTTKFANTTGTGNLNPYLQKSQTKFIFKILK